MEGGRFGREKMRISYGGPNRDDLLFPCLDGLGGKNEL